MQHFRTAARLRIMVGESSVASGRPAHEYIVHEARRLGLAGATVIRGVMGFGANSLIHTAKILRLSEDLPMLVEVIDSAERIAELAEALAAVLTEGVMTVDEVQVRSLCPPRVRDAMSANVVSVDPDTPLDKVLDILMAGGFKSLPVVSQGRVLGMITGGDLLNRAKLTFRLSLQRSMPPEARAEAEEPKAPGRAAMTARDIMSAPVITIGVDTGLRQAASLMAAHNLKRLPVLDQNGGLAGIISRVDVLKGLADLPESATGLPRQSGSGGSLARDFMFTDVPTVGPDEPLSDVVAKIVATPLRRVVVTDEDGRVAGIILDRELIKRFSRDKNKGVLRALLAALSGDGRKADPMRGTAREVMREAYTIGRDAPASEVLRRMIGTGAKRLVVIDPFGHLAGMVDRDSVLRLLAELDHNATNIN